jgi:lipoprotein-anchoring transpeptidase ErfK/SrfK
MESLMLRARIVALACLAIFPSMQAMAEADKPNSEIAAATASDSAAVTTDTPSGTTTYFGGGAKDAAKPQVVAKPQPPPKPTLTASIDLASQKMVVKVNGEARYSWPISSGVAEYPTPTGTFHPQWTAKMWYSRKYDMAPMPNAVFINGGVAVHGTYHVRSLGSPASHGCIRLSTAHAKTFYDLVQRHGLTRTRVSVFGRPHWRAPAVASRDRSPEYADNQGSGFWGDSWGGDSSSAYAPTFTKKKSPTGAYYYYDADGVRRKVSRRKNGDYVYSRRMPRAHDGYGYAYGGSSQDW